MNWLKRTALLTASVVTLGFGGCTKGDDPKPSEPGNPGNGNNPTTVVKKYGKAFIDGRYENDGSISSVSFTPSNSNVTDVYSEWEGKSNSASYAGAGQMLTANDFVEKGSAIIAFKADAADSFKTVANGITTVWVPEDEKAQIWIGRFGANVEDGVKNGNAKAANLRNYVYDYRQDK